MNTRGAEFFDQLSVAVTLTIADTEHKVPGGSVVHFDLDLTQYGFSAEVEVLVQDDKAHGGGFEDKLITDFTQAGEARRWMAVNDITTAIRKM